MILAGGSASMVPGRRAMSESFPEVHLARHGETAWTISRQHTGETDIDLTEQGGGMPEVWASDCSARLSRILQHGQDLPEIPGQADSRRAEVG